MGQNNRTGHILLKHESSSRENDFQERQLITMNREEVVRFSFSEEFKNSTKPHSSVLFKRVVLPEGRDTGIILQVLACVYKSFVSTENFKEGQDVHVALNFAFSSCHIQVL
jgi:hypothetical protein